MRVIVRTREELFTTTVGRVAGSFDVVVNGNYLGVSDGGKFDALIGHDPVPAAETSIQGRVLRAGQPEVGDARPRGFFLEEVVVPRANGRPGRLRYVTGVGNPPAGAAAVAGIGNVGPLIVGNLPYGQGNRYKPGKSGPLTGDPGAKARADLVQRNNNTFASVEQRDTVTGKTVIAYHEREGALLVGVQPDGEPPGQSYAAIRNGLRGAGFSDAVFLDGSDSAMLWHRGRCVVRPGDNKDELMTVGLGFVHRPIRK